MAPSRTREILTLISDPDADPGALAQRLVELCTASLPVTGAGLVVMTDAGPAGTVAVSDGAARTLEDLQFTLGEGPCVASSSSGRPVLVADLAAAGPARWPAFTEGALAAGVRAVFALPLRVGGIRLGVLDLYRAEVGLLGPLELAEALAFADAATTVLLHLQSRAPEGGDPLAPSTVPVLDDRAEVHQATGMVSVQADVPLATALLLLRARAFATGRPVADLARDVLAGAVRFDGGA
ncbi:GAF domain-containing protein [uncultured Pseudokineococcus sp.]|uniref:GAF domain-containing protein n=1 Tax=uncultured Pseudokineococcus sp. TaxID=1642928 RepID=UPI0026316891|nr:GAF domain-containing protein [uncultured Pseudokineococcus sp.]